MRGTSAHNRAISTVFRDTRRNKAAGINAGAGGGGSVKAFAGERPLSGLRACDYVRAYVRDLSLQLALYFREMFAREFTLILRQRVIKSTTEGIVWKPGAKPCDR